MENIFQDQATTNLSSHNPLGCNEAAQFLKISKPHLYKLTSQCKIPHYKKGKKLYFKQSELEEWAFGNPVKTLEQIEQETATRAIIEKRGA